MTRVTKMTKMTKITKITKIAKIAKIAKSLGRLQTAYKCNSKTKPALFGKQFLFAVFHQQK